MKKERTSPLSLGIRSTYKGYHYLVASLELALQNENDLLFFTKTIFPEVAAKYHTNISCVERNIRTVIHNCWNSNCRQRLLDISPYPLEAPPSVGEFLDILFWNLQSYSADSMKEAEALI